MLVGAVQRLSISGRATDKRGFMSPEESASAGVYFQGFPLSHTTQSNRLFGLTNEITLKWSAFKICFILALAKNSGLL